MQEPILCISTHSGQRSLNPGVDMSYSFADFCSIVGLPVGLAGLGYAVWQQRRADSETAKRGQLAAEAQRFLVGLKPSFQGNAAIEAAVDDQLERLKPSLKPI